MKTHESCATIIPLYTKISVFRDLTGSFPHNSSRVNLYAMVLYEYYSNDILDKLIKNRQAETIRDAFLDIHNILKSRGSDRKVYIMYN